jgi:hypothetical protein
MSEKGSAGYVPLSRTAFEQASQVGQASMRPKCGYALCGGNDGWVPRTTPFDRLSCRQRATTPATHSFGLGCGNCRSPATSDVDQTLLAEQLECPMDCIRRDPVTGAEVLHGWELITVAEGAPPWLQGSTGQRVHRPGGSGLVSEFTNAAPGGLVPAGRAATLGRLRT